MKVRGKRSNQFGQSQWEMMLEAAHTDAPYETQGELIQPLVIALYL